MARVCFCIFATLTGLDSILFTRKGLKSLLKPGLLTKTRLIHLFGSGIALADIIGLGSMVPVLMLAIDHSFLEKSSKLRAIYSFFEFASEAAFLKVLIGLILLFFIVKNLLALWLYRYIRKVAISISADLAGKSFDYVFRHNAFETVAAKGAGFNDLVMFTPYYFVSGIYMPYLNLISEITVVFMLVLVFTIYNPTILFLIVGFLGSAFWFVNRFTRNRITSLGEQGSIAREKALKQLNIGVGGFADIKTHGVEGYFKSRFLDQFFRFSSTGIKAVNYQLIPARINEFVALLGIVVLVVYAYFFSDDNIGEVRVLAALFAISVFRLIPAANRILQSLMHLKMNAYTIGQLQQVTESPGKQPVEPVLKDAVELKDVTFSYGNKGEQVVFDSTSLTIRKGDVIGISGPSGIGKTTLAKLLLGYFSPDSGSIFIDGKDVSNGYEFFRLFGYMGQEPYIVNGTVADNVALGIEPGNRNPERIRECLKSAALELKGQSDLLDCEVGESGSMLSEGQRQRLVLARELYRDAPVLILDEPTSALDAETEDGVLETLKMLKNSGRTMIIIAHRERIFEFCTVVYTIENQNIKKR